MAIKHEYDEIVNLFSIDPCSKIASAHWSGNRTIRSYETANLGIIPVMESY